MRKPSLIVIAKPPLPGRAKTRLTPPLTPVQAARLAEAALLDTLDVVRATPCERRVLVFDGGKSAGWRPDGFEVIAQRGVGLAARLAAAFADVGGPALLVGMDTPQLTPALLSAGMRRLMRPDVDAVLGPAADGGYWSIGLRQPCAEVFAGVPMSEPTTCAAQRARLADLGLAVSGQPVLRDVDTFDDALAVARSAPRSRFAAAVAGLTQRDAA
jgi:rSAM/selenodomain-associated transferase 1